MVLKLFHSNFFLSNSFNPANIHLLKVNNRNIRKKCEICLDVIDVVLVFLLLTLDMVHMFFSVSIVEFEQVNVDIDVINIV